MCCTPLSTYLIYQSYNNGCMQAAHQSKVVLLNYYLILDLLFRIHHD